MGTIDAARVREDDCDWVRAHAELSRLARERSAAEAEEGRWLLRALRSGAHVYVGCASFAQYIERLFGYSRRTIQEKLRVAEALEELPQIASALDQGALHWCAARELTRVAVADTEREWLEAARGKTARQLEELVSHRNPGDGPTAPPENVPRPRVLRFEVAPETFALFREAMQQLRRAAGGGFDDDAVLLEMARQVLGGPVDEGRSSYQVSMTVCAACGHGEQLAAGDSVPVDDAIVAMAQCDAQLLGPLLPRAANENAGESDECPSSRAHVGALRERNAANDSLPGAPAHASYQPARRSPKLPRQATPRAKQTIPPALRRAVLLRDQRRCRVPGCTHATFVDVHHIQLRSDGGRNHPDNLITLCSAHHRANHRGQINIERQHQGKPTFQHADGSPYGDAIAPQRIDAHAKVFSALRQLGFREREVKLVLAELRACADLRDASTERLLREALCRIRTAR